MRDRGECSYCMNPAVMVSSWQVLEEFLHQILVLTPERVICSEVSAQKNKNTFEPAMCQ
jgi:hypothetical protein